jgi:signal transduction histidine kinase
VNESSNSIYFLFSEGGAVRTLRLCGVAVIFGTAFVGHPHPSLTGNGLVILISLVVAAATQVTIAMAPFRSGAMAAVIVLSAVSCGVLAGYEPTVGTAILLIFVGLSAGANLELGPGGVVSGLAVVTTAISVLASGQGTGNISLGAVVVVGFLAAAGRKQYVLRAEEAEMRLADAERAREEHARAAALAERANAAREIHDILAHALGAVLEGENHDPGRANELLARARALAVEGLSEARQAVGTLRTDAPPLLDGLHRLVDATAGATLEIAGTPRPTTAELAVALRRTAQEALTNAGKHAPGSPVEVELAFGPDEIVLTVTDAGAYDGITPGPLAMTGGGYGIEGLRERAELIGGTLVAGPYESGWQVRLCVPDGRSPGPAT